MLETSIEVVRIAADCVAAAAGFEKKKMVGAAGFEPTTP